MHFVYDEADEFRMSKDCRYTYVVFHALWPNIPAYKIVQHCALVGAPFGVLHQAINDKRTSYHNRNAMVQFVLNDAELRAQYYDSL
jgi:hypothetical protein